MQIAFVIASLRAGGAERVASLLCNEWAESNKVSLITFDGAQHDFYRLDPKINRFELGFFKTSSHFLVKLGQNIKRLYRFRSAIKAIKPDLILSFMDVPNGISLLGSMFTGIPVVISERVDPHFPGYGFAVEKIKKALYRWAAACVCQTQVVAAWAREFLPKAKVWVIPNPIQIKGFSDLDIRKPKESIILAIGRLEQQKGFERLISAFHAVSGKFPDWDLIILGEGSERASLSNQVEKLGLLNRVYLPGLIPEYEISDFFRKAACFALSSRAEGFPNALLEAMAHGLAVVSFDCPSGPAEIILSGVNGFLVPDGDVTQFSEALTKLMNSGELRRQLGSQARLVREKYQLDKISDKWLTVFREILDQRAAHGYG